MWRSLQVQTCLDSAHLLFTDGKQIEGEGRGWEGFHGDDCGAPRVGSTKVGTATTIYIKSTRRVIDMKLIKIIRFQYR